jgi:hypothetical protein
MQTIVWLNTAPVYVIKGNKMNSANKAAARVERFDNLESALIHFAIHPSNWHQIE